MVGAALVDRLLQRVEDEVRGQGRRDAPADDPSGEDVDDERDVDEAAPGRDVREVRDPQLIRPCRREVAIDEVARVGRPSAIRRVVIVQARPRVVADEAQFAHQPPDRQRATRRPSRPICFQTFRGP